MKTPHMPFILRYITSALFKMTACFGDDGMRPASAFQMHLRNIQRRQGEGREVKDYGVDRELMVNF